MGRHLILRGVDQRWIGRIRERAGAFALGPSELVRALLTEVAVKVIDIFGKDTMTIVPVNLG